MALKQIRVVAAVVKRDGLYLITQRRDEAVLAGLWEFPGGKVESGESDGPALAREFRERLGAELTIGEKLTERHTAYPDYEVALALYSATVSADAPLQKLRVKDFRWIRSDEFETYPFPAADQKTTEALLGITRWEPK